MIFTLILILHVVVCLILIASVLVQQGKGASMGAAFGTGGSQTVFGGSGAGTFLTKVTAVCAAIFFSTSLILAFKTSFRRSVVDVPTSSLPTAKPEAITPGKASSAAAPPAPGGAPPPTPRTQALPAAAPGK